MKLQKRILQQQSDFLTAFDEEKGGWEMGYLKIHILVRFSDFLGVLNACGRVPEGVGALETWLMMTASLIDMLEKEGGLPGIRPD